MAKDVSEKPVADKTIVIKPQDTEVVDNPDTTETIQPSDTEVIPLQDD